jgi:hypothetical protein
MARAQTFKQVTWRKYKTNPSITIYNYLKIDGHTETPLMMLVTHGNGGKSQSKCRKKVRVPRKFSALLAL